MLPVNMYAGGDQRGAPIEQLVKESTQELLIEPDFSKFLDLVDSVNAFGKSKKKQRCAQLVQAIARRLENKKRVVNVVYLCFHLIDFAVKNLQPEMPRMVASPLLQKVIIKVGKARATKGRALAVIIEKVQEWSYLFQHLGGFQETYIALQKAGLEFPVPSKELIAEQTKLNTERIQRAEYVKEQKRLQSPEGKMERSILLLEDNLLMVSQMLAAVDPSVEEVSRSELIPPLITSISQQRPKIADLIVNCTDESLMSTLLKVNDDVNNCMEWYQQLLKGERPNFPEYLLQDVAGSPEPVNQSPADPKSTSSQPPPRQQQQQQQQHSPLSPPPTVNDDPFAAFAASRKGKRSSGVVSASSSSSSPPVVTAIQTPPSTAAPPINPLDALFGISNSSTTGQPQPLLPSSSAFVAPPVNNTVAGVTPLLASSPSSSTSSSVNSLDSLFGLSSNSNSQQPQVISPQQPASPLSFPPNQQPTMYNSPNNYQQPFQQQNTQTIPPNVMPMANQQQQQNPYSSAATLQSPPLQQNAADTTQQLFSASMYAAPAPAANPAPATDNPFAAFMQK